MSVADPRVGVVVLTYNRANTVTETITRLQQLEERPRVVVVDNASADGTSELLEKRFPSICVLKMDRNLGAAGRNAGVEASQSPYIALCDDDTWWESGGLKKAADILDAYPHLALITARVLVGDECRLDPTCHAMAASPVEGGCDLPGPALLGFLAGASVIRRSAFMQVGGFEPRLFLGAEESLVAIDLAVAGWAMAYVDDIDVHHHPSPIRDTTRRRRLLARNRLLIGWLRRPARRVTQMMWAAAMRANKDSVVGTGLTDAIQALPWAIRNRRVVPAHLERQLKRLDSYESD